MYDPRMATQADLPSTVRERLARLVRHGDRGSPTVFVGRDAELAILDDAVLGTQEGQPGLTVAILGVPGAGKTALANEYATRLLVSNANAEAPAIPIPLRPADIDAPPIAIVQKIDQQIRRFETSNEWRRRINRAAAGASLAANTVFAAFTKRDFNDFTASARAPDSLSIALDDYAAFRVGVKKCTLVLLVDEAQNLDDTARVRAHLDALHGGLHGRTDGVLACFGLANTADHLRELGLSRLAADHISTIGPLSDEDAQRTVFETLRIALAGYAFNEPGADVHEKWIGAATATILDESANFPHHLANGCRALAGIVLNEGIGKEPPDEQLREECRKHKREYYNARLQPWSRHMTALNYAFGQGCENWTPIDDIVPVLMASDNYGRAVDERAATAIVEQLCAFGYVEERNGAFRPTLPSLSSHFALMRHDAKEDNKVVRAVRAALNRGNEQAPVYTR